MTRLCYSRHVKWVCVPHLVLYCTAGELSGVRRQYANECGFEWRWRYRHKAQLETGREGRDGGGALSVWGGGEQKPWAA